jgi:hypothetical protein
MPLSGARGVEVAAEGVDGLAEALWASVDDKGIRGRLYREDCEYLANVIRNHNQGDA